jgi:hypothetical protein
MIFALLGLRLGAEPQVPALLSFFMHVRDFRVIPGSSKAPPSLDLLPALLWVQAAGNLYHTALHPKSWETLGSETALPTKVHRCKVLKML